MERDDGLVPLESNARGCATACCGRAPTMSGTAPSKIRQTEMLDPSSVLERRLRQRIGELLAQQSVEDEGAVQAPRGEGLYHRYNAIRKRSTGTRRAQT